MKNQNNNSLISCPGCHATFPVNPELDVKGGYARYGVASAECLDALNKLLAYEYEHGCMLEHRFDAYGVQHPPHFEIQNKLGIGDRYIAASKQSMMIHLLAVYMIVEKKMPSHEISAVMNTILSSGVALENEYDALILPKSLGSITIADVIGITDHDEHMRIVQQWNEAVWNAWTPHHGKVKEWYKNYVAKK